MKRFTEPLADGLHTVIVKGGYGLSDQDIIELLAVPDGQRVRFVVPYVVTLDGDLKLTIEVTTIP